MKELEVRGAEEAAVSNGNYIDLLPGHTLDVKTPCVSKRTGLIKEYNPTTHQCDRGILIIAQNSPFAIKNVKENDTNAVVCCGSLTVA